MYCYLCVHMCSPAGKGFRPEDSISDIQGEENIQYCIHSQIILSWVQ